MDLNFTADELAFRHEIRDWVAANLPASISHKVHNALHLTREDMQGWARILGRKGWHGYSWPKQFGGPGWTAVQRHLFEPFFSSESRSSGLGLYICRELCARHGARIDYRRTPRWAPSPSGDMGAGNTFVVSFLSVTPSAQGLAVLPQ